MSATVLYMSTSLDARVRSRSRCCAWRRRVVEVVDWGRPSCLELSGLAMSFPRPHRSNKDKLNAKEVR